MNDKIEIYKTVIEALEKQIPYKTIHCSGVMCICKCGRIFLNRNEKYCANCGQMIDW